MINVPIHQEIRKYKEKVLLGLTARQLLSVISAFIVSGLVYFIGGKFLNTEIVEWLIFLVVIPIGAIGFLEFNGMKTEKFMLAFGKYEFLLPRKRGYKTVNAFRKWNNRAEREEQPKSNKERRRAEKVKYNASLERSVLIEEAEENGNNNFDVNNAKLVTVSSGNNNGKKPKKEKKEKTVKEKEAKGNKLQAEAEAIEAKIRDNPRYLPTKKENRIRAKWNATLEKNHRKEVEAKKRVVEKKNDEMKKRRTAKTTVPKTTQDTIPYIADYEEGMFEVSPNKYSKVYLLQDINYMTAKTDEQVKIFCKYGEFLNHFSDDVSIQVCIDNRLIAVEDLERQVLYPLIGEDDYDVHREEYNRVLRRQIVAGRNEIQTAKFITVTIDESTPIEALLRFHKIDEEIKANLEKVGCKSTVLSTEARLAYYHDKYRKGREGDFKIDFDFIKRQGISSKDYIAPSTFEFSHKYFKIEDTYYRVMYISNLPASLSDEFIFELCDGDFPAITTLNIQPVAHDKGMKIVKRQLTGIEKDKAQAEQRAIRSGYSPEIIRHDILDAYKNALELYDDMQNKNQKMFFVTMTIMVQGETLDELNQNCKIVENKARKYDTQLLTLTYQQEEGYKITMPFGYAPKDISVDRTLTTESTAIFIPFRNQELFHPFGRYFGLNQVSNKLVTVDRFNLKNPSGFTIGTSGSGKSFLTKLEIIGILLHDNHSNVFVIDPENEYSDFGRVFGATILKLSPTNHDLFLNPLDMEEDYGLDDDDVKISDIIPIAVKKEKALKKKSEYILSIVENVLSGNNRAYSLLPTQKTIIDRCVYRCYENYLNHDFNVEYVPTLVDFQNELEKERGTEEGRIVADAMAYYTTGSMNLFAHKTNVDIDNRFIIFNIKELRGQLQQIAFVVLFDFIWNRMVANKVNDVVTYCYCDEIHVMFRSSYSAMYLRDLYKRGRKYGLIIHGITQNLEDLYKSDEAHGMITNSDFVVILNQAGEDIQYLTAMKGSISETELEYVIGADVGCGLLCYGENAIIPFVNRFPKDSYLYDLISTKFGETSQVESKSRIDILKGKSEAEETEVVKI